MSENGTLIEGDFLYGLALFGNPEDSGTGLTRSDLRIYAARASGLYHSVDGEKWDLSTKALNFEQSYSATAVAVTPNLHSSAELFLGLAGGLLYSLDGGDTWQTGSLPNPPPVISCFAVSPDYERDGIILAGSLEDGVLRSADRGRKWVLWNFGLLDLSVMCLAVSPQFTEDETVFAGTESGMFRSTNGGRAWRELEMPSVYDPVMCLALTPDFRGDEDRHGLLLAGTESEGLYRSEDRGKSWQRLGEDTFTGGVQSIVVDPSYPERPNMLVVGDGKVYLSTDGGLTWQEIWSNITAIEPAVTVLAYEGINSDSQVFLGLVSGNVHKLSLAIQR